jgi:hypothetical protein
MTGGFSAVSQVEPGNIMDIRNVSTIHSFTSAGYLFIPAYKVLSMFHPVFFFPIIRHCPYNCCYKLTITFIIVLFKRAEQDTFTPMQGQYNQPSGTLTDYTGYSQSLTYGTQMICLHDQEALGLVDDSLTEPFMSQNLVFNIIDVSPDWGYCTNETKVWLFMFTYFLFGISFYIDNYTSSSPFHAVASQKLVCHRPVLYCLSSG